MARSSVAGTESIELSAIGIQSILTHTFFHDGVFVFNRNEDPKTTIEDIIDQINAQYTAGWLSYA